MLIKTTKKLYKGKYQYNIVLVCAFSVVFRGNDLNVTARKIDNEEKLVDTKWAWKNPLEFAYAKELYNMLITMDDFSIRVESPTITCYTNNYSDIIALREIDISKVRRISVPMVTLTEDSVYMPEIDYEFRVTIGGTKHQYLDFLEWADAIDKLRITNSCREMLSQRSSYGGGHFYVNGENMLLMCRMQLAGINLTVHRIVH
jgi:hypothetical protein